MWWNMFLTYANKHNFHSVDIPIHISSDLIFLLFFQFLNNKQAKTFRKQILHCQPSHAHPLPFPPPPTSTTNFAQNFS